jgi:hypothetical protein
MAIFDLQFYNFRTPDIALRNAQSVVLRTQDRWRIIQFLNQYGMIHYAMQNNRKAITLFKKAQEEALKTKHPIHFYHLKI